MTGMHQSEQTRDKTLAIYSKNAHHHGLIIVLGCLDVYISQSHGKTIKDSVSILELDVF